MSFEIIYKPVKNTRIITKKKWIPFIFSSGKGGKSVNEAQYRVKLMRKIEALLPGCIILKNDPDWIQGIPDLLILYNQRWAALEVKLDGKSKLQPNQIYFVEKLDDMSFAAFIFPENEDRVLNDLQFAFGVTRATRIS